MRRRIPIPAELAGDRADKIVAQLGGVSRQRARSVFALGVTVDGEPVAPDQRVGPGVIEFEKIEADPGLTPEPVAFTVVYEDLDLLVVEKPAGIVVHPGAGKESATLAAGLLDRFPELAGVGGEHRSGLVHRLDKETSGLLLVARNGAIHTQLSAQLAARDIHRRYLALVHGEMAMPTGTIDAPIGPDPNHPTRKKVSSEGRPARTHYRVLWSGSDASLLEVTLETGRTHQIRAHMASIDHPVVGDRLYSRRPSLIPVRRMFLHAAGLRFTHPRTGAEIEVSADLPSDLLQALGHLPGATETIRGSR